MATPNPLADNIIRLYQSHAQEWDTLRGKTLFEKGWLNRFLELLPAKSVILDIGCGSGEPIAHYLIGHDHQITGVDSANTMITLCQQRFPDHEWLTADMRTLSLSRRFNGLIAWDSFFHLSHDDQRKMFPVFRAHANPHAALLFTSGPLHGEAIGELFGEPLYHSSLAEDEYRDLLTDNGFNIIAHTVEDPDCGGHTVWLARHEAGADRLPNTQG